MVVRTYHRKQYSASELIENEAEGGDEEIFQRLSL